MANRRREIERRCEQMRDLVQERAYEEAWRLIADIDPEEVEAVQDLRAMAEVQEQTRHYDELKKTYLHLYNTTTVRHNLKSFIQVLIRIGEIADAKVYLKEFEKMDGAIADDFELRYAMADALGISLEERIQLLEDFKSEEYMEVWGKKLADLYKQAGREAEYKQELADLHLWFGGVHILPDEPEEDPEERRVGGMIEENLAARMEAESDIENAITESVGAEVSRIVEESAGAPEEVSEPTLDDMLSETGRTEIEQLEVEPVRPTERLDVDAVEQAMEEEPVMTEDPIYASTPVVETVGMPKTASGAPMEEPVHTSLEAKYLNRRGQAETVGEPVKTDDPTKAKRFEELFVVDDNYEEGPADFSTRGVRYWTTRDTIAKIRRRDCEPPHFVLAGGEEKITLTITKRISKELTRLGYHSAQKVMRITAERMNSIHLMDQIDRLIGRCLLVTEAAELTKESVDELMQVLHEFGDEFVVVLSGPFDEIDCFLQIYPELNEELGYKVRVTY
ncbi:MAG: hypothetical protein VZQ83_05890 [Eubacterium sp.]|nr:hypothetical protein [Eubacterium sp.]